MELGIVDGMSRARALYQIYSTQEYSWVHIRVNVTYREEDVQKFFFRRLFINLNYALLRWLS